MFEKEKRQIKKGDKIKFKEEIQRYTVKAISSKFAICTKPFNARKTVLYTVIDFAKNIRGTENLMPFIVKAVREYASIGEIMAVLTLEFGRYVEDSIF